MNTHGILEHSAGGEDIQDSIHAIRISITQQKNLKKWPKISYKLTLTCLIEKLHPQTCIHRLKNLHFRGPALEPLLFKGPHLSIFA